jgi:hypothetical protein
MVKGEGRGERQGRHGMGYMGGMYGKRERGKRGIRGKGRWKMGGTVKQDNEREDGRGEGKEREDGRGEGKEMEEKVGEWGKRWKRRKGRWEK